ncbi:hypothetical protein GUJ93_ZPchr0006g45080 [Zizania palustris]|uniref:Uncharacterized protein n=1 Tax=Zizania palustris TaxID=103762 RepID=A0A8J5T2C2_ZIZPA|nr:hypothetical protein GUJ93_ZPchr0006g45080 [Zizania palustris]
MTYTHSPSATTVKPFSTRPSWTPGSSPTRCHVLAPGSYPSRLLEPPCARHAYILTLPPPSPLLPVLEKDGEVAASPSPSNDPMDLHQMLHSPNVM